MSTFTGVKNVQMKSRPEIGQFLPPLRSYLAADFGASPALGVGVVDGLGDVLECD